MEAFREKNEISWDKRDVVPEKCPALRSFSQPAPDGFEPCANALAEGDGWFAYFENPAQKSLRAAAGAVWSATFSGANRFRDARNALDELFKNYTPRPDSASAAPPCVFCAFNFEDDAPPDAPFASATLFLPRWQYTRLHGQAPTLTFNELCGEGVAADDAIADDNGVTSAIAASRANEKFFAKTLPSLPAFPEPFAPSTPTASACVELGGAWFAAGVERALAEIAAGHVNKVVLARAWEGLVPENFNLPAILRTLSESHPRCTTFAIGNGTGAKFFGATPELLLEIENGILRTEALAGTAPCGATAAEDAAFAATLQSSDKEQREHAAVVRAITEALQQNAVSGLRVGRARVARFNGVQHLWTPISARLPANLHLLDLANALHPSPALGGTPRANALALIRALEPSPRETYAGPVGWIDATGGGRLHAGIRSALLANGKIVFRAGAGIVAGATPAAELAETLRKSSAIRDIL